MSLQLSTPAKTLAIASHVVSGFVGNNVVTFVLQALGIEVAALNTVQFSNHTGYHRKRGSAISADEISELWKGLKEVGHDGQIEMVLSGYVPGAAGVHAMGEIANELKRTNGVFWLLDPVMGDEGKLYVSPDVVPAYKELVGSADLITPNQYEVEWLCDVPVVDLPSLRNAISTLHRQFRVPHIVITSVTFPSIAEGKMLCAGSTLKSNGEPRPFLIEFPIIPGHFRGTGDMFSALTLARFREEVEKDGILSEPSWISPDAVSAENLPLARSIQRVLQSMNLLLERTRHARESALAQLSEELRANRIALMRAGELRLVQGQEDLRSPQGVIFEARAFPI